jgi:hypothetical protein
LADKDISVKLFKSHSSQTTTKAFAKARSLGTRMARSSRDSFLETLEGRTLFSAFVVNVTGDPSFLTANQVSLRKAVTEANATSGTSTITFSPTVFNTPQTLDLAMPLEVSNPNATVEILGPTQQLTILQDQNIFTANEIKVDRKANLVLKHLNFTNDPQTYDTALIENAGNLAMLNCTISEASDNSGVRGIYNTGLLELSQVTIANYGDGNSGVSDGAGLFNGGGTVEMVNTTFNNDDAGIGGAIGQQRGQLLAINVTINNCGADSNGIGGAVSINSGEAIFEDCTIANSWMLAEGTPTGAQGVAIYASYAEVKLVNDTITNSQLYTLGWGNPGDVPTSGSIYVGADTTFMMGNSVVSGMSEVGGVVLGTGPEIVGQIDSLGHNFIGQTSSLTLGLKSTDLAGTHTAPQDPKLGALANNGGYVETEMPEVGSPLINAGNNTLVPGYLTKDERGAARIYDGAVDIGAVETDYLIIRPIPRVGLLFKA